MTDALMRGPDGPPRQKYVKCPDVTRTWVKRTPCVDWLSLLCQSLDSASKRKASPCRPTCPLYMQRSRACCCQVHRSSTRARVSWQRGRPETAGCSVRWPRKQP
eukprot:354010-Chlamydomonas_euryale.AAC.8